MKITKRQLKRIIKEERRKLTEARLPAWERPGYVPEHGEDVPIPPADVEELYGKAEGALDELTTALSRLEDIDPQEAVVMAEYAVETLNGWMR